MRLKLLNLDKANLSENLLYYLEHPGLHPLGALVKEIYFL